MSQAKHHGRIVSPDAGWEVEIFVGQHGGDKREGRAFMKLLGSTKSINPCGGSNRKADFRSNRSGCRQLGLEGEET